jgi:hypothetical protein
MDDLTHWHEPPSALLGNGHADRLPHRRYRLHVKIPGSEDRAVRALANAAGYGALCTDGKNTEAGSLLNRKGIAP